MSTKHFGDRTAWGAWSGNGSEGWSEPGWALPQDPRRYISKDDPYWGQVLDRARHSYGDPKIHFDNDVPGSDRHLVFGDGIKLPADGAVVYHNAGTGQNWAQNDDGTTSLVGADGQPGAAVAPAGYRKVDDRYAPVNEHGDQVGPLLGGVPDSDNGFYSDPKTGMLTPKNADGGYYTLGPDGAKSYFDKSGAPISERQFSDPAGRHPDDRTPGMDTDEQQSGRGAEAVRKMNDQLHGRYSAISDADEKFSEVLLNAHATNAAGRDRLQAIQKTIEDGISNPAMSMDTPAGERAFLTFLRDQTAEVNDLVASGALAADDQSKVAQAISALYAADTGAADTDQPEPAPALPALAPSLDPAVSDPGVGADLGLGPSPQMPDPSMGGLLGSGAMPGADPFSSLVCLFRGGLGVLGGLGSGVGSPLDGLSGLGSALGDLGGRDHSADSDDAGSSDKDDTRSDDKATPADKTTPPPATGQPADAQQPGQPDNASAAAGSGQPPAAVAPPVGASPAVTLPDGSTATARSAQAAAAVRDYLAGTPVDAAYRQNNIELPPPGTPITNPVDVSKLTCGDVAMFKDHYEPVLSAVKGFHNGQVVPLGSVASSPEFLGFFDPLAAASSAAPPASAPAPVAAPPPPGLTEPVPAG